MTHQPRRQHVPGSFARVLRGSSRVPLLLAALSAAISPLAITTASGCGGSEDGGATDPAATDGPRVHGLTEQQAAAVVAKVGERNITAGELAEELAEKGSFIRTRYASPERRREFLDQMIRFELLAQEAHRRGYDELPEVTRAQKQMMIRRFLEARFDQGGPDSIPADEVAAYYEAHRREFNTPEQVRASHIRFRDRATAQRVLRELLASPADLQLFRRMNDQHNTDEDAKGRMGDLRFFSRPEERTEHEPDVPAPVATAAFAIEQLGGYYPEVVETEDGFHIVKLTGRRAAMSRPLADAERPIRSRLFRERRETGIEALVTQLREEADVEENLDVLSEIHIELPQGNELTIPTPSSPFNPHIPADAVAPTPPPDAPETP